MAVCKDHMLRDAMLIATQPTAAPGAKSFRADCGLSAGDGERLPGDGEPLAVDGELSAGDGEPLAGDGEPLAGDGERLAGDGERLAGDGEQSAVAFQFTVRNHRNRI